MYYIGIDLGGTNIAVGVVDEDGKIIAKAETPTLVKRDYREIVKDMAMAAQKAMDEAGVKVSDIKSIGIGSPGTIDRKNGIIVYANNLFWRNVPLREELQKYLNVPVYIDNDANVAGLAEHVSGACRGVDNSITLTLGTGVGAGVVINGKLYIGTFGAAAELGHLIIEADGLPCTCGSNGCFEQYASATALIREGKKAVAENPDSLIAKLVEGDPEKVSAKVVIDAAKEGDPTAKAIFDKYIHYLAIGIVSIINAFDPAIIALGGGVSKAGSFLLDAVVGEVKKYVYGEGREFAKICLAELGNDAGIIGAAMLGKVN